MSGPRGARLPLEGGPTFPRRHRVFRGIWGLVWVTLGIWTPAPLHAWRRFLLGMFGARLHRTAKVYPWVEVWYPPNLTMEEFSCLARGVRCYCMAPVSLAAYALVSQRAHLCAGTHDVDDPHFQLRAAPIGLGTRSWVAAEAFVGPGVTIGQGAVLGARGVAMRDLDPWTIYAGNPARRLRLRKHDDAE